jgi:sugar phosphate isomerase/epimerase
MRWRPPYDAAIRRIALEPHPYRWVNSAQSVLRLMERTGASNLGLNLDPSHLFPSGDLPHYTVYLLGTHIYHTHFSDNDGQSNAHWRPGKGKIDWTALLRALSDVGYDDAISLELEDVPGAATHDRESTSELDRELRIGMAYLRERGAEAGVTIGTR